MRVPCLPLCKCAYPKKTFTIFRINFLSVSSPQGEPGARGQPGIPGTMVRLYQKLKIQQPISQTVKLLLPWSLFKVEKLELFATV